MKQRQLHWQTGSFSCRSAAEVIVVDQLITGLRRRDVVKTRRKKRASPSDPAIASNMRPRSRTYQSGRTRSTASDLGPPKPTAPRSNVPDVGTGSTIKCYRPDACQRIQKNGARGRLISRFLERRSYKIPPSRYSPTQEMCSTIAEAGLNFRVRNGNGCGPRSIDGGKTLDVSCCSPFPK